MNSFFFFLSELIINRILIVFLIKLSCTQYLKKIKDKSESYSTQTISCSFNLTFLFFSLSQALLAAEAKTDHCPKTMGWLVSRQKPDGSFTNLLGTMYVLPSLIGALPYDLQHIPCPKNTTGKRYDVVQYIPCSESSGGNRMRFHNRSSEIIGFTHHIHYRL